MIFGCLLLVAYPALTTAIALLRAETRLGQLFWHVVTAFDRNGGADAVADCC